MSQLPSPPLVKVEFHINGKFEIHLKPEHPDAAWALKRFLEEAQRGVPLKVTGNLLTSFDKVGEVVIGVER